MTRVIVVASWALWSGMLMCMLTVAPLPGTAAAALLAERGAAKRPRLQLGSGPLAKELFQMLEALHLSYHDLSACTHTHQHQSATPVIEYTLIELATSRGGAHERESYSKLRCVCVCLCVCVCWCTACGMFCTGCGILL